MSRDDSHLLDMLIAARRVQRFASGRERRELEQDEVFRSAVLFQLLVLGEAAKRVSPAFREAHPEIVWKEPAGMRDRLIHGYNRIDLDKVWDTMMRRLPELIPALEKLIPPEEP